MVQQFSNLAHRVKRYYNFHVFASVNYNLSFCYRLHRNPQTLNEFSIDYISSCGHCESVASVETNKCCGTFSSLLMRPPQGAPVPHWPRRMWHSSRPHIMHNLPLSRSPPRALPLPRDPIVEWPQVWKQNHHHRHDERQRERKTYTRVDIKL
jgi:hypothetical protein